MYAGVGIAIIAIGLVYFKTFKKTAKPEEPIITANKKVYKSML